MQCKSTKMPAKEQQQQQQGGATKFFIDLGAGIVAKTISTGLTYPLHRGVCLIQVEGANPALGAPATPYRGGFFGFFDAIRQTSNTLGALANYRGVGMAIVGPVVTSPVSFAVKDRVKHAVQRAGYRYTPHEDFWKFFATNMLTGGLAGALTLPIGLLVAWPVKVAQADLRPEGTRLSGFGHCKSLLAHPLRTGSLMARALPLSAFGIVMFRAPYFGIFDTLKEINPFKKDRGVMGFASKFAIAQTTALLAGAISYPFGLITGRFVVANAPGVATDGKHVTLGDVYRSLKDSHGVRGLWRGWPSQFMCTVTSALVLIGYDEIKRSALR